MASPLLAFNAGRAFRREGTNMIDHDASKGAIYLYKEEGLLHFQWKTRPDERVEEVGVESSFMAMNYLKRRV